MLQESANDNLTEGVVLEKTLSILDLIINGGTASMVVIGVLLIMLAVALFIYFERTFALKAASKIDKNFMAQIKEKVLQGKLEDAKLLCAKNESPIARLTEKGISRIGKPLDDINKAIENAGTLEVYKLEKKREHTGYHSRCRAHDWLFRYRNRYDFGLSPNGQ